MDEKAKKKNAIRDIIITVVAVLFVAIGIMIYLNRVIIYDWMLAISYNAPAEVSEIEEKIFLTDRAKMIFAAARPSLNERDEFNHNCDSHEKEVSILGCYTDGQIHVFNIESEDLDGIVESTMAHELLHAVWERMGESDKSQISVELMNVLNDERYHEMLMGDLDSYNATDKIDELHSRIGTEIADLPTVLEEHYARYFKDQDLVVDYYNSYIAPFRELDEEIHNLEEELERTSGEIDQKTADYYQKAESLSREIDEFNACTNTQGCFANNSAFIARRNELMNRQSELEELYNQTNDIVNYYNNLVGEYNAHILRGKELEKAMNSNIEENKL